MTRADPSGPGLDFDPSAVEARLRRGVAEGAFPGAVALWGDPLGPPKTVCAGQRGRTRDRTPVTPDLIYDLASVTKILAATSLALVLAQRGRLDIDRPLADSPLARLVPGRPAPEIPWNTITPAHLMAHQSGLRPWRPLYRLAGRTPDQRRQAALAAIWLETPQARPGRRTIYSDLNFILLGRLLEELGGAPLDWLFQQEVAEPLGLSNAGFRPGSGPLAPTEDGFRHGGPVGHPEAAILGPTPLGRAHDDNASWLGGVAGHAGLFAPARAVWAVAADWARARAEGRGRVFTRDTLDLFLRPRPTAEDLGRPLGFNLRDRVDSLAGSRLSPDSVGHLGYTGPALWWDLRQNFLWLLLTNRVHPSARNPFWSPARYQGGL